MRNSNPYFLLDNAVVNVTLCTRITAYIFKVVKSLQTLKFTKIRKVFQSLLSSSLLFNSATAQLISRMRYSKDYETDDYLLI